MILTTALISAIAPAALDAVKTLFGGIARKVGGLSVDDEIKLLTANVERLKALAGLDTPVGNPSQWVVDLRASFRYIAAALCVVLPGVSLFAAPETLPLTSELAASAFSFIFGERLYFGLKGIQK